MDRRQKKTKKAIYDAFIRLLEKKNYNHITVQEIIDEADVGRATFYAHFETKDYLLKSFCEELFVHISDASFGRPCTEGIYAHCSQTGSVFLHLLHHLKSNDDQLMTLLSCRNNELFLSYFKESLKQMLQGGEYVEKWAEEKQLPEALVLNHTVTTFMETVLWWMNRQTVESPKEIEQIFFRLL